MKFQNPSIYGSAVELCITKHAMYKCPNYQRAITHEEFVEFLQKLIRSSSQH